VEPISGDAFGQTDLQIEQRERGAEVTRSVRIHLGHGNAAGSGSWRRWYVGVGDRRPRYSV